MIKQGSLCLLSSLTKAVVLNVFVTGVLSVHTVQFHLVSQDRGQWQDFVNTVMNSSFHKMQGLSGLAEGLLASQE